MTDHLSQRRARVGRAWQDLDGVVLIASGAVVPVPGGADQTYPFLAHSDYYYLTEVDRPGRVLAHDPQEGEEGWVDFAPPITLDDRIWEGREGDEPARPITELSDWLDRRAGRRLALLGAPIEGRDAHSELSDTAQQALDRVRRIKDEHEMGLIRRAVEATAAAFAKLPALLVAGTTERRVKVELEAEFFRHGGDSTGYGSIVGSGPNAAVFHFDPGERTLREGEVVLIDAGAQIRRYTADVTRTFGVGGELTGPMREIYDIVLRAQKKAVDKCRPGVEWRDIHFGAAADMTRGLIDMGLLKGAADDLVARDVHALFFPHGVGHMVGLGVRDASGYLPGRERSRRFGLSFLRMDLPLEPGHVVTVEPGLYFSPALLRDPVRREAFGEDVNWDMAERLIGLGGVRIEDNLRITDGAPENLTAMIGK
ncbi:MAG: aminopeptidase P N-terminal domain-containing protein [Phycisphaerales bacterium JB039]